SAHRRIHAHHRSITDSVPSDSVISFRVVIIQIASMGQFMSQRPLQPLEDLILESLNPRAITGLPHPLSRFAANGAVKEGPYADAILASIHDLTWREPDSAGHRAARWLLFESERAFFRACAEAGIDAEKLRNHPR